MADAILDVKPLGFPWPTLDPFLFCVHHDDAYPRGNDALGPAASLEGRNLGMDFEGKDGWRMYHGDVVPGFPQHPHRGFETVTIARRGFIDHADSLGATARFGRGDVQWMTAGRGIVHAEMFPLLDRDGPNPVELFQIWLNLPRADKLVDPHFSMLWSETIPRSTSSERGKAEIALVAGALHDVAPPPPPPRSWAARADADVAIWTVAMEAGARVELPRARGERTRRTAYFFAGPEATIGGRRFTQHGAIEVRAGAELAIEAGEGPVELLILQGRPIAEPTVQHGPFVMNSPGEIRQAMLDYHATRFGGWPWPSDGPVHARDRGRFAKHADGRVEER